MVSASNRAWVKRLVISVGMKHVHKYSGRRHLSSTLDSDFGRDLAQLEAPHVSHIMKRLLRFCAEEIIRAIFLQIFESLSG